MRCRRKKASSGLHGLQGKALQYVAQLASLSKVKARTGGPKSSAAPNANEIGADIFAFTTRPRVFGALACRAKPVQSNRTWPQGRSSAGHVRQNHGVPPLQIGHSIPAS